ncbi:MAG: valine--tRNA ligase [Acidobacteriota bacterium]
MANPHPAADPQAREAKHFDPASAEARWQRWWEESRIYRFDPSNARDETFVVDTPPPTVSGSLHVGHVFSYTHQDVIVRQQRMRGKSIFYPIGWDDNGLPTERRVQNVYGVRCEPTLPYVPDLKLVPADSREERPVSRANFIELCHEVTARDELAYEELYRRLSLSVDWSETYATIDRRHVAAAQRSFVRLHRAGHVYQAEAPTLWDVDFRTAVAQAEVEDRQVASAFHEIEMAVEGGGSFVIATTRPELLAACVGIAAHPEDARYRGLLGRRAITPLYHVPVPIFATSLADPAKGTGILMVCTFGDQTDVLWWREERLALRQILGRDGRIAARPVGADSTRPDVATAAFAAIAGRTVKDARRIVGDQLRDPAAASVPGGSAPLCGEPRPITHSVKFYEKGDRPLEILTTKQWFVRLLDKKDDLLRFGSEIAWHPPYMGKRFENWTEGLSMDWCVSRQRHFGVPIPVWYGLPGSSPILPEEDRLPIDPMTDAPPEHREADRGTHFAGEADVFDTWFTSSLTPMIAAGWGWDEARFAKLFPMDVRPQSHEIIRTWAFYSIAKAMLHERSVPWRHVVISGWILDPDRKKMAKSKGNVMTPMPLIEKYGSDAVRYWSASARLGTDTAFDEGVIKDGRRLVTKIWNAAKLVYGCSADRGGPEAIACELDRAFLGELREVVRQASSAFEDLEFAAALQATERFFFSAFTDDYIELSKRRARSDADVAGRASAVTTLRLGLSVLLRLFAPILPVVTEEAWSWGLHASTGHASIHRASWPTVAHLAAAPLPADPASFRRASQAIAAVRTARTASGLSLSAPVAVVHLDGPEGDLRGLDAVLSDVRDAAAASEVRLGGAAERVCARIEARPS